MARFAVKAAPGALDDDDDWETDPDFENKVSEKEQRYAGTATVAAAGRRDQTDLSQLAEKTVAAHDKHVLDAHEASGQKASRGYGGRFGVESAPGDKAAMSWEHKENVEKHSSQKDYASGFGGKYGVQTERFDKAAVGYEHKEKPEKHSSQKDYSEGFGGKYGVQQTMDQSAAGYEDRVTVEKHSSQKDYTQGFGGKYGVQNDRADSSAGAEEETVPTQYKTKVDLPAGETTAKNLRERFEKFSVAEKPAHIPAKPGKKWTPPAAVPAPSQPVPKAASRAPSAVHTEPVPEPVAAVPEPVAAVPESVAAVPEPVQLPPATRTPEPVARVPEPVQPQPAARTSEPVVEPAQLEPEGAPVAVDLDDAFSQFEAEYNDQTAEYGDTTVVSADTGAAAPIPGFRCRALYSYVAADDDELSFSEGDIIERVEQVHDDWWAGACHGKQGIFPAVYSEPLE